MADANATIIRKLNDDFRKGLGQSGKLLATPTITALSEPDQTRLLQAVQAFDAFTKDNDPHAEHDFGTIEQDGERYFWKIDYYDQSFEFGSGNPADPAVTRRVLTIMRADEYASLVAYS